MPIPPSVSAASGPTTALIVVNYGSHALVRENLSAFDGVSIPPWLTVVVVDNFSTADERARIGALCEARGWVSVTPPRNEGFGRGVDLGIAAAGQLGCAAVVLLNPDAVIDPPTVAALRDAALDDPNALVAPRVVDSAGADYFCGAQLDLRSGRTRGMRRDPDGSVHRRLADAAQDWVSGACVAFSLALTRAVGGMGHATDDYFLYWEDVDLSHRVLAAGGTIVVRQDLVVVHDEGGTQQRRDQRAKSSSYYYWNTRNRLVFAARNLDASDLRRWIRRTPAESWAILLRGGRRQLLHSPGLALAALRGSVAGVVAARRISRERRRGTARFLIAHPGAELYGSDRVMVESAQALVDTGAEVTVTVPDDGPLVDELRSRGITVIRCPAPVLRKSALRPRGAWRLLRDTSAGVLRGPGLVRRRGRDGVYVSTVTIPLWLVLARVLGRPLSCHVHEAETGVPRLVQRVLLAPLLLAPTVLVNSRFSAAILTSAWPSVGRRAMIIDNPVPGPAQPRMSSVVPGDPLRLLFIGRLSPRKGPQVAIDVAARLRAEGVPVHLTLLGSAFTGYEWFVDALHEQVRQGDLADAVDFVGFDRDVWRYFADSDVVLIPSQADEPFGNTAVEAVLAARPVVVSAQGGLVEAIDGYASAQGVQPDDVTAWVDAVGHVVDDRTGFAGRALDDAARARWRHDPARYRERIQVALVGRAVLNEKEDAR